MLSPAFQKKTTSKSQKTNKKHREIFATSMVVKGLLSITSKDSHKPMNITWNQREKVESQKKKKHTHTQKAYKQEKIFSLCNKDRNPSQSSENTFFI